MSIVKVIEVLAQSEKGFEDAARQAIDEASKSIRGIKSLYIKEMQLTVENGKPKLYRIDGKLSFEIDGSGHEARQTPAAAAKGR